MPWDGAMKRWNCRRRLTMRRRGMRVLPPLNGWFFDVVYRLFEILGGDRFLASAGFGLTLFWR